MKEILDLDRYARLILSSNDEFSYLLIEKFYKKNRKDLHDLIKKVFEISIYDHMSLHNSRWTYLYGKGDEYSDYYIKKISSSISISKKDNQNSFTIYTTHHYTDKESELHCFYLQNINDNIFKKTTTSLFKIKYNKNKSFKIVKVLSKKSFYEIFDNIFKDN
jgi:hypothetical protein